MVQIWNKWWRRVRCWERSSVGSYLPVRLNKTSSEGGSSLTKQTCRCCYDVTLPQSLNIRRIIKKRSMKSFPLLWTKPGLIVFCIHARVESLFSKVDWNVPGSSMLPLLQALNTACVCDCPPRARQMTGRDSFRLRYKKYSSVCVCVCEYRQAMRRARCLL